MILPSRTPAGTEGWFAGDECDVLVVGGGPAGSATALLLARAGWSVTVLDRARFPRPKACGECINPGATAALARLGLLDDVLALSPARIRGWEVCGDGRCAIGEFKDDELGLGVDRTRFDHTLLQAASRAGARVLEGVSVRNVGEFEPELGRVVEARLAEPASPGEGPSGGRGRTFIRADGLESSLFGARAVVGADGLRSVVARRVGAPLRRPRLRKLSLTAHVLGRRETTGHGALFVTSDATVGIAPVHERRDVWNVTVVVSSDRWGREAARDPAGFMMDLAESTAGGWDDQPELVEGPWPSGPFDWPMRRLVDDGLVLVGDAAGYYDPLTGQGIYRALHSAELAAETIDQALRTDGLGAADLRTYEHRHHEAFAAGLRVQHAIENVLARPALRRGFLGALAKRPAAMDSLIAVTADSAPVRSLLAPSLLKRALWPRSRARR